MTSHIQPEASWVERFEKTNFCLLRPCSLEEAKKEREILQILVAEKGWVSSDSYGKIELISVPGEMSMVNWYKKGNEEYNGKYVIQITYKEV